LYNFDATGLYALEVLSRRLKQSGRSLLLCGARLQPAELLHRADFMEQIGRDNILPDVQSALDRAAHIYGED
jgi:SulP family sulfate permease